MTLDEVRRRTIIALFSDDELMDKLVLKGGSALRLVHQISERASLDLDFSLESDFEDLEDVRRRIFHVLKDRFEAVGYVAFDISLEPKPNIKGTDERPWWGGYELKFKVIEKEKYDRLANRPDKLRIDSLPTGPAQQRVLFVDFSKNEYTQGKQVVEIEDYLVYVYSLEMLVIEKLRALCQQMREYEYRSRSPKARARDFYDIHLVLTSIDIDLATPQNRSLLGLVFAAKKVPPRLLALLPQYRELHRPDWPSVIDTTPTVLHGYDF